MANDSLDFATLVRQSVARAIKWHPESTGGLHNWSELEWAGAMAGEVGECCNNAKKLRRVQLGMICQPDHSSEDLESLKYETAKEAADTLLYAVLVMHICGYNPEEMVRKIYNKKSEELGFPERL